MTHRNMLSDIVIIGNWLNQNRGTDEKTDAACRVLKLAEECGEAADAFIGMTGQNPRKGITHTIDDLTSELADVAITAMAAIYYFTDGSEFDLRRVMRQKCDEIMVRANLRGA